MFHLGFIINPFAGIGGKVGLKGSDGEAIRAEAFARGAVSQSANRARITLEILKPYKDQLIFFTASGDMGENLLKELGFNYECVYSYQGASTAQDTIEAANKIVAKKANLFLFAGGDGTARNIYEAVGEELQCLVFLRVLKSTLEFMP